MLIGRGRLTVGGVTYVLTPHAVRQAARRRLAHRVLRQVLQRPEARFPQRPGRDIFQSRVTEGDRTWLVRVVVDVDRDPAEVVTVYRTSSIHRYWRDTP
jgi:hypothetical protein